MNDLEEFEKDYLKFFLEVVENNGLDGLVVACQNKNFAMYPFVEIIKKIVGLEESF